MSTLTKTLTDVINSQDQQLAKEKSYQKLLAGVKEYNKLKEIGLIQDRGYTLLRVDQNNNQYNCYYQK